MERYEIKYDSGILGYWVVRPNQMALIEMTDEDRKKLDSLPSKLELEIHDEKISVGEFRRYYLPNLEVVELSGETSG